MLEMYDKGLWTDVKFRCKDHDEEEVITAHKIVLAARSPVFQAMFFGPCADGKGEVELKNVEKEILHLFLRFIYSDTVELAEENAFGVLEIAHFYQVPSLVQFCADYLATIITPNNACEVLRNAMLYKITSLRDVCCSFIDNQAKQVLNSDNFMNLSPEHLLYILKGDTFYADEEEILKTADKWSRKKVVGGNQEETGLNIRKCLGEAFYQLRLPTMTYKSLLECTSREGYFSVAEYADIAGYINKLPGISVPTNSCTVRLPEIETLKVNNKDKALHINDSVSVSFEILVAKDVAMLNIALEEIKPYLKSVRDLYTSTESRTSIERNERISPFMDRAVHFTYDEYAIFLKPMKEFELPENLGLELSVNVVIKYLEFEQNFRMHQTQPENCKVNFNPPLVLEKSSTPYCVEMKIQYSCEGAVQIGTKGSRHSSERISSKSSDTQAKGCFCGIKSIEFKNISNRDAITDNQSTEAKEMESNDDGRDKAH
ncbi:uncharacterized protein LOC123543710 [Mercenaria mercenaria]|uniref:uncharacterized protein LOC123543710 n=1 Tax=Mercenaria mercenaria TaxID=6596 RepID=UPI00234F2A85|nr:uncharacterized protein LOC123543710 [Mercenaria mercenaria]